MSKSRSHSNQTTESKRRTWNFALIYDPAIGFFDIRENVAFGPITIPGLGTRVGDKMSVLVIEKMTINRNIEWKVNFTESNPRAFMIEVGILPLQTTRDFGDLTKWRVENDVDQIAYSLSLTSGVASGTQSVSSLCSETAWTRFGWAGGGYTAITGTDDTYNTFLAAQTEAKEIPCNLRWFGTNLYFGMYFMILTSDFSDTFGTEGSIIISITLDYHFELVPQLEWTRGFLDWGTRWARGSATLNT